ncbi:flavodoxin family protein [Candidatus Soleaferrea massiliensis]|uniref:flavodoxin family protein n=1 Tax=Candidatus Soleaferrea massiliensis TaxID=1470354 RepID=UPI00058D3F75|nr:NAD(P)H-dependent oxidoreductase [Candidatus Soleaferrea massiliensis]
MKITVINGTQVKGCTHHIKEIFLDVLRKDHEITEYFLPKDCEHFCCGCKSCFLKSETLCPHAASTMPIWNSMLESDLLVFVYPVYALRTTGQMKALLDHLCCHWMVHRPDRAMFSKRAVILTQSIGAPNTAAQKDVKTSLKWMGVSSVKCLGFGLMEGIDWDKLSAGRRVKIERRTAAFAEKFRRIKPASMGLKVRVYFMMCKILHKQTLKHEATPSADNQHYIDNGWIKPKRP